jgi:peptide/nickel transport system permease protein
VKHLLFVGFRDVFSTILSLIGVASVVFLLFSVLPGDPARLLAGNHATNQEVKAIRSELGLEQSIGARYVRFLNDLSPLSLNDGSAAEKHWHKWAEVSISEEMRLTLKWPYFGRSYARHSDVSNLLWNALPESLVLVLTALFLAFILGVPSGIWAARFPNGRFDRMLHAMSAIGMAVPSFVVAMLVAWVFGYVLHDALGLSVTGSLYAYDYYAGEERMVLEHLILPAMALSVRPASLTAQLMRDAMSSVLMKDYIRTARSKGLGEFTVLMRHGLPNAVSPVLREMGAWIAALLVGSVFVEFVFGWKGLGHLLLMAIEYQDFPVIIGLTLVTSAVFIIVQGVLRRIIPVIDPTQALS